MVAKKNSKPSEILEEPGLADFNLSKNIKKKAIRLSVAKKAKIRSKVLFIFLILPYNYSIITIYAHPLAGE
jgi:hypothetical protein